MNEIFLHFKFLCSITYTYTLGRILSIICKNTHTHTFIYEKQLETYDIHVCEILHIFYFTQPTTNILFISLKQARGSTCTLQEKQAIEFTIGAKEIVQTY